MKILRFGQATLYGFVVGLFGVLSASAEMPNPNFTPWADHSKQIKVGVDLEDQHFATVVIHPKGNGLFDLQWTCENGKRGSRNDGRYQVEFMQTKNDAIALDYDLQDCRLGRDHLRIGQETKDFPPRTIDLSKVIDNVRTVKMSVKPLDSPQAPPLPPGAHRGTVSPPPVCDKWHPECH